MKILEKKDLKTRKELSEMDEKQLRIWANSLQTSYKKLLKCSAQIDIKPDNAIDQNIIASQIFDALIPHLENHSFTTVMSIGINMFNVVLEAIDYIAEKDSNLRPQDVFIKKVEVFVRMQDMLQTLAVHHDLIKHKLGSYTDFDSDLSNITKH